MPYTQYNLGFGYRLPSLGMQAKQQSPDASPPLYPDYPTITKGALSPTGKPQDSFQISIGTQGEIIANTLNGTERLGQLSSNGNYQLNNGQQGNIFESEVVSIDYQLGEHPFLKALKTTERNRAMLGSEIPMLRAQMKPLGLTGQGVKIAIIDPYENPEKTSPNETPMTANPKISPHSEAVQYVINHPAWGTAPGASVVHLPTAASEPVEPKVDNVLNLVDLLNREITSVFNRSSEQIQQTMLQRDPSLRIINTTWGTTRSLLYTDMLSILSEKDTNSNFKFPIIRYAVLGPTIQGTIQDRFRAITRFVDQQIMQSPSVLQAKQHYIETTRQATEHGIIPVVSVGNDRNLFKEWSNLPTGSMMNELAKSPYVISVAASNTHLTPGNYQDDTIAPFSSPGDGFQNNPTIAAPGQEIGIGHPFGPHGQNCVINGTSFSTPFTCGVIALMLQANPSLTFQQVHTILQQSAVPVLGSVKDEGAGILNSVQAVYRARALPTTVNRVIAQNFARTPNLAIPNTAIPNSTPVQTPIAISVV